jgi:hypothetical protein
MRDAPGAGWALPYRKFRKGSGSLQEATTMLCAVCTAFLREKQQEET